MKLSRLGRFCRIYPKLILKISFRIYQNRSKNTEYHRMKAIPYRMEGMAKGREMRVDPKNYEKRVSEI